MPNVVVGDVEFNVRTGELVHEDQVTRLRPHAAEVLSLLIENAGQLVSRQQLFDRVWPRGGVELDLGLNVCIRQIRAALGDDADAPRYIETLRGRGYRLIAPVQPAGPDADPIDAAAHNSHGPRVRVLTILLAATVVAASALWMRVRSESAPVRIAVLPFSAVDLPDSVLFLGSELAAGVITRLATLNEERLAVIARTSSFHAGNAEARPDRLGATLGADYLVSGSIGLSGSQYVMNAHLIDVSSDTYAWSRRYVVSRAEALSLDGPLTNGVLEALDLPGNGPALTDPTFGMSTDARMGLLGARYLLDQFTRESAQRALVLLDRALDSDSSHGQLWVARSRAHLTLGETTAAQEAIDQARAAGGYVPGLDLAEARLALYGLGDVRRAVDLLSRAVVDEPGVAEVRHTFAQALSASGALDEAAAQGEVALDLDPISATVRGDVGWIFYYARDFSRARAVCRSMLELRPSSTSAMACMILASNFEAKLEEEAGTARDLVLQLGGTQREGNAVEEGLLAGDISPLAAWLDERGLALGLDVITRARALALLDRDEGTTALLIRAASKPGARLTSVLYDPVFDGIRGHASYPDLVEALGAA